jgi:DNA-binding response OmpR family regulator
MALIVVCEDDAMTRTLIAAVLDKAGHLVETFDNGFSALVRLMEGDVELLISDVQMPHKNGFELIADVRKQPYLVEMPCILLTSLDQRAHMRVGMTSGADDYVTKPFQPSELIAAVDSQLERAMQRYKEKARDVEKSVSAAVGERTNQLMRLYELRLREELQSRWERTDLNAQHLNGTLVCCSFLQSEAWASALTEAQLAVLLQRYFGKLADSAALFHAEYLQYVGDGLLLVFDAASDTSTVKHQDRALKWVNSLNILRASMQAFCRQQWPELSLPTFKPCLALHRGAVSLAKIEALGGGIDQSMPVGQAVGEMSKMLKTAQALRWSWVVSEAAWSAMSAELEELGQTQIKLAEVSQPLRSVALRASAD